MGRAYTPGIEVSVNLQESEIDQKEIRTAFRDIESQSPFLWTRLERWGGEEPQIEPGGACRLRDDSNGPCERYASTTTVRK